MKKRACIVSGLAALAALFLAARADASITRSSSPAREAPTLSLTLAAPDPSEFSLFDGTEIARALASRPAFDLISITTDDAATAARTRFVSPSELSADELPEGPELVPITSVREQRFKLRIPPDVFGLEPLRGPPGDEASYPKTRYRVFGLLGTPILGELRGVSLELRWGCASFSCGLTSGTVGWLSQDPMEDRDSPNLYGFVGARPHEKTDPLGLCGEPGLAPCGFVARAWWSFKKSAQKQIDSLADGIVWGESLKTDEGRTRAVNDIVSAGVQYSRCAQDEECRQRLMGVDPALAEKFIKASPQERKEMLADATGTAALVAIEAYAAGRVMSGLKGGGSVAGEAGAAGEAAPLVGEAGNPYRPIGRVVPPSSELGPGPFGNEMHKRIVQWLRDRYPTTGFQTPVKQGATGIDVTYTGVGPDPGFNFAEIKPRNAKGLSDFMKQMENWKQSPDDSIALTYDKKGNIYIGWDERAKRSALPPEWVEHEPATP